MGSDIINCVFNYIPKNAFHESNAEILMRALKRLNSFVLEQLAVV